MKFYLWLIIFCCTLLSCQKNSDFESKANAPVHVVKRGFFPVYVEGRCELRSQKEEVIRIPAPLPQVNINELKLNYVIEEGTKVEKGQLLAQLASDEIKTHMTKLESEIKISQSRLERAEKKLAIEKSKLEAEITKVQIEVKEKKIELDLLELAPGARDELKAHLALSETRQEARNTMRELLSYQILSQRKLISSSELKEKQLQDEKAQVVIQSKKIELAILQEGAEPLKLAKALQDYQKAQYSLKQAQNNLEHKLASFEVEIRKAEQELYRPQKALKNYEKFLGQTKIISPSKGVVLYKRVWSGSGMEKVKKGMQVWGEESILSIQDLEEMEVMVEIPESLISQVKEGQEALIKVDSVKNKLSGQVSHFIGKVNDIGEVARYKEEEKAHEEDKEKEVFPEKVFEVIIELNNKDPRLKPGLNGSVQITVKEWEDALSVPITAVFSEQSQDYVFLQQKERIEKKEIEVGIIFRDRAQVEKGLENGDKVLLKPNIFSPAASFWTVSLNNGKELELRSAQRVKKGTLEKKVIQSGEVFPLHSLEVVALVSGEIKSIVPEGSEVKEGERLFVIGKSKNDISLDGIQLKIETHQTEVSKQKNEYELALKNEKLKLAKAQLEVDYAEEEWQLLQKKPFPLDLKKMRNATTQAEYAFILAGEKRKTKAILLEQGLISEAEFSSVRLEVESSEASFKIAQLKEELIQEGASKEELNLAQEKLRLAQIQYEQTKRSSKSEIHKHEVALEVAQSQLREQEYLLRHENEIWEKGILYAPMTGTIRYQRGYTGKPEIGKKVYAGEPIILISNHSEMMAKLKVNEVDRHFLEVDQKARVQFRAFPKKTYAGKVVEISPLAKDRSEDANSFIAIKFSGVIVFQVKVEVEKTSFEIKPGMSAMIEILTEETPDSWIVDKAAIFTEEKGSFVFFLRSGKIEKTFVEIKASNERDVAVSSPEIHLQDIFCLPIRPSDPS